MKRVSIVLIAVVTVLLLVLPLILKQYLLNLIILTGFWIILATSLGLIVGYTGQMSFGHMAFYGIGAYASALLTTKLNMSFWVALPLAAILAGILGFSVGIISLRLKGPYFAIVTLAFGEIIRMVMNNWTSLTGGPIGVRGIKPPDPIFSISFDNTVSYYYLTGLAVLFSVLICRQLIRSKVGRAMVAIREDESLAESLGINSMAYKTLAFTVGTVLAGIAGSLYAHYILFISPTQFTTTQSIDVVIMAVFGGAGTLLGPLLGVVVLQALDQALFTLAEYRLIIYGFLLILVITLIPQGLIGIFQQLKAKFGETKIGMLRSPKEKGESA